MIKKITCLLVLIFLFALLNASSVLAKSGFKINFNYLNTLRRTINTPDKKLVVWATSPESYEGLDVSRKLGNFSVTTDEMAEVALLYLTDYERFGYKDSLDKAYEALDFLLYMQEQDGRFSPSIDKSGTKDSLAPLGKVDTGTVKAFWAIAYGVNIFQGGSFANKLQSSSEKTFQYLQNLYSQSESEFNNVNFQTNKKVSFKLLNGSGQISAFVILGLCEYYKFSSNKEISSFIEKLSQGLLETQWGNFKRYPFFAFLDDIKYVFVREWTDHYQVMALAKASKLFNNAGWLRAAENEANGAYTHLIASGGIMSGWYPKPEIFPQTPKELESLVSNLVALYQTTKKKQYAEMAGLLSTWLLGDNIKNEPVYLSSNGKCFSELNSTGELAPPNLKSTVAALKVLILLEATHGKRYINYTQTDRSSYFILESEEGIPVDNLLKVEQFSINTPKGAIASNVVLLDRENVFWHKPDIKKEGNYLIYLVYLKQPGSQGNAAIAVRVDGGKIYNINASEPIDESFMAMEELPDLFWFDLGFHSIGVRYSGLLYSFKTPIDCLIVQPQIEYKLFKNVYNQYLLFLKSFSSDVVNYRFSTKDFGALSVKLRAFSSNGFLKKDLILKADCQDKYIEIPIYSYGCTFVGWQSAKEQRRF